MEPRLRNGHSQVETPLSEVGNGLSLCRLCGMFVVTRLLPQEFAGSITTRAMLNRDVGARRLDSAHCDSYKRRVLLAFIYLYLSLKFKEPGGWSR